MRLNADFSHFACVTPDQYRWVDSPSAGVERMMLDRIGDEVARATSLVRYAPNSQFSRHTHGGGEEILVLEGVFADEHGRYPAGSYLRNPIGTGHTPQIGEEGALILVKLHQFDEDDLLQLAVPAHRLPWQPDRRPGITYKMLHTYSSEQYGPERVSLERWEADTTVSYPTLSGGLELFVLEGAVLSDGQEYATGSWCRFPVGAAPQLQAGSEGVQLYLKRGHLAAANLLSQ
ncbi:cupin domain-containing protein [Halomonas qinghailakensis]|uniref:Cupin domain-containing protein n=1 Tax=Halomonas qinghailakensis TaxID=2937790 RepID=A0AA46TT19_9GAMM|nr:MULTISPECIES: cupin domain-containing protein [Halomonas]UYO75806.1 cupin domain-containing protein [Halomonas sp. ZZQ-149]